jgi:aminoglycoside phosphotransferase (APT) family kinase protein
MAAGGEPSEDRLREALQSVLATAGTGRLLSMSRRRSQYRSSFPLEDLSIRLEHGDELRVAFKRLAWEELNHDGRLARPCFLFDATREPAVYRSLLAGAPAGPPSFLGAVPDDAGAGCWLFLEWVEGRELYQVGERSIWIEVADWLGRFHVALTSGRVDHAEVPLLQYDAAYYRRWLSRAREYAHIAERSGDAARFLDWLAMRYDAVVEALLELPSTIIHGDFNASNVLVYGGGGDALRVAPLDWELAAVGPGLMDLAALISGDWTEAERQSMAAAYAAAEGLPPFSARQLDFARLQLAVQWLGWAPPEWVAPVAQRHDWMADASSLAQSLEI